MQKEPNGQTVLKAQDWGLKFFSKMAANSLLPSYPPDPSYFVECLNLVMELNSNWSVINQVKVPIINYTEFVIN